MSEDVPLGWTVVDAGQLIERIDSGKSEQTLDRRPEPDECGVVKVSAVTWGSFDPREAKAVLPDRFLKAAAVNAGDLLLSRANTAELVGAAVLVERAFPNLMLSDKILRLHLRDDIIDKRFMLAALRRREARDYFADQASGTSDSMRNVSQEKLRSLEVPLAPLNEQRRIVAKLDALLARSKKAREHLDRIPALLDALKRSILAAAFRGDLTADWRKANPDVEPANKLLERIRAERRRRWEEELRAKGKDPKKAKYEEPAPVDESELPELPEGWCWASWEQFGTCQNGRAFPSTEYCTEGVPLLRPGNLHVSGDVKWSNDNTRRMPERWATEHPEHVVRGDELVINLTAQSLKDEFLGRICLTAPSERCLLNQRIARLTPTGVLPRYVLWLFKSPVVRSYINDLNTGSLIQHMFTSQVEKFALPIAPLSEQQEIILRVEAAFARLRRIQTEVDGQRGAVDSLDRSALTSAFQGELVPQDPDDEPADVMLARLRAATPAATAKAPRAAPRAKQPAAAAQEAAPWMGDALDIVVGALVAAERMTAEQVRAATGLGKDDVTPVLKGLVAAGKVRVEGKARGTAYVWAG